MADGGRVGSELELPDDETVGWLQAATLRALLARDTLPGGEREVRFPDLPALLRAPAVTVLDENLGASMRVTQEGLGDVRVVSSDALRTEAERTGEIAHLRFAPPVTEGDMVRITLEARLAAPDATGPVLGFGGVVVRYRHEGEGWVAVDEPTVFAT